MTRCMGSKASPGGARQAPLAARAILNDLRFLVRALRVSSKDVERTVGISGAQLFVLQCLTEGAPYSMRELAAKTHTDQSSVSVVVARLAEKGLVRRVAGADDARRVEVHVTAKGKRLVGKAPEPTQARLARALDALPVPKRAELAFGLAALVRQMGLAGEPDRSFEEPDMFFEEPAQPSRKKRIPAA
jgi:DNA-binding MarR family transcriptional regulator